jgi:sugar phosphate isomerase/epimerase
MGKERMNRVLTGMVSVTFRQLPPEKIAALAKNANLDGIEWGGDVHCPPGDKTAAQAIAALMEANGLETISYGSYYRTGTFGDFASVVDTAAALNAPNIRVWAGSLPSAEATGNDWRRSVEDTQRICDLAAVHGICVSFEYHGNTLTDTFATTVRLLEETNRDNCRTYWQPPVGSSLDENLDSVKRLAGMGKLMNFHVFSWEGSDRMPLAYKQDDWVQYIRAAAPANPALLLEFVAGECQAQFLEDAKTLLSLK